MLLLFVELLFMAAGIYCLVCNRRLVRHGLRADAEVVDMRVDRRGETPTYYPIVRFRTADGREVVATTRGGYPPAARTGDRVRVIYQPHCPQTVAIDTIDGRGVVWSGVFAFVPFAAAVYQVYQMTR